MSGLFTRPSANIRSLCQDQRSPSLRSVRNDSIQRSPRVWGKPQPPPVRKPPTPPCGTLPRFDSGASWTYDGCLPSSCFTVEVYNLLTPQAIRLRFSLQTVYLLIVTNLPPPAHFILAMRHNSESSSPRICIFLTIGSSKNASSGEAYRMRLPDLFIASNSRY